MLLYTVGESQNIEDLIINPFTTEPTVTAHADTFGLSHLIRCDKKSEIVRYFEGRLCDKIGPLCDKLCDFFQG